MLKKCSVLKPWPAKKLNFFSFSYYNFEGTATHFDTDIFKKESFPGTKFYSQVKTKFKCLYLLKCPYTCTN